MLNPAGASAPVERGSAIEGTRWLSLEPNSEVVVRHASSAREYSVAGPALVLPCREGMEEIVLTRGELRASQGGGARAGAFVTVATPWGTVRYGHAALVVRVTSRQAEVSVNGGSAWLEAGEGARLVGGTKLTGPKAKGHLLRSPSFSIEKAIAHCEASAALAEQKAKVLLGQPRLPGFGKQAAEHVKLRRRARQACRIAESALQLADKPDVAKPLGQRLSDSNQRWQDLPEHEQE